MFRLLFASCIALFEFCSNSFTRYLSITCKEGPKSNSSFLGKINSSTAIDHSTEDKLYWCEHGKNKEELFVRDIVPKISKKLIINPEKQHNPYAIDLVNSDTNEVADLKTQNTPFFSAGKYKSFDGKKYEPQYTVTFNRKDYEIYCEKYSKAIIYW